MHPLLTHTLSSKVTDARADNFPPADSAAGTTGRGSLKDADHTFAVVFEGSFDQPVPRPDQSDLAEKALANVAEEATAEVPETDTIPTEADDALLVTQKSARVETDRPVPATSDVPAHRIDPRPVQPTVPAAAMEKPVLSSDRQPAAPVPQPVSSGLPPPTADQENIPAQTRPVAQPEAKVTTPDIPVDRGAAPASRHTTPPEQIALQRHGELPSQTQPTALPVGQAPDPQKTQLPKSPDTQAVPPQDAKGSRALTASSEEPKPDHFAQQARPYPGKDAAAALAPLRHPPAAPSEKSRLARSERDLPAAETLRAPGAKSTPIPTLQQWTAVQPQLVKPSSTRAPDTPSPLDADGVSVSRGDVVTSTSVFQSHMMPGRADLLPQHISRQIAEALQYMPNRPVEITLNPEELGRVRLGISTSEGNIIVSVLAERPETSDLMRRHISALETAFQELGYTDITFAFGGGSDAHADSQQRADGGADPDGDAFGAPQPEAVQVTLTSAPSTGMDIRL